MENSWLAQLLGRFGSASIAVFGDFCVDSYWSIDPDERELSIETGLPVRRVRQQRCSLGGAGNVVANLVDLGVGRVLPVGLIGADLFGRQMLDLVACLKVPTEGLLSCQSDWQTLAYCKPCVADRELNRIDFGAWNVLAPENIDVLAETLRTAAHSASLVVLNQQLPQGVSTLAMIERINAVIADCPNCRFIVDSRHRPELYRGASLKLNAHEAARLLGTPHALEERIGAAAAREMAGELSARTGQPVFVTRGENGIVAAEADRCIEFPGIQITERTDPVGAGDTALAALSAALAVGADVARAAELANIAASITVRKLQTTGTATPAEILSVGPQPDYVYHPELADDPRGARFLPESEIEIVETLPGDLKIRHAIFDHDGTISTLREGWERIMEPMMVRAILGPRYADADETLYHAVVAQVRQYIDKTTGVQTLVQMRGLCALVEQFGCVPPEQRLDMHGYKRLYNDELLAMVRQRLRKLERGELQHADFQIAGAVQMLKRLHERGVALYLASGTDQADVLAEARAMGYAELFEGRIHGAVGDITAEAKRQVIGRILQDPALRGPQLAVFGDGPVEIREARKRGAIAIGVASDEMRRFGANPLKRARLIRAGAEVIIPDFTQHARVAELLGA